ncbi:MAG: protein translocase subunit SecF [Gammaproteobacteria bacterium]|nr:protein translocase subunit SecF [Gammaproteobacteria bacterium]
MTEKTQKRMFKLMEKRSIAALFSAVLILVSIGSLFTQGLNLGIDFTGGTLIEVGFSDAVELDKVRDAMAGSEFSDASVQYFGSAKDILIRVAPREGKNSATISTELMKVLSDIGSNAELRRQEFVGPQVGEELTEDGGLAMLAALAMIMMYVAVRFQMRFSVGAIAALMHDVIITMGFFSLTQLNFDLTVLAAILAVIGYSLNDTIVVYDRIRENFRRMRTETPLEVLNISLNQTLSRTMITSLTTLLVLTALFVVGGEIIHSFSAALLVGVIIGTYSSIYIASPVILALGVSKQDLMPVEKEGAELDDRP